LSDLTPVSSAAPSLTQAHRVDSAMTLVGRVDDVPLGEGREVIVDGRRIALFHTPTAWYAIDAICPHRGGPLADGIVCDHTVICPLHDRHFDLATGAASGGEPVMIHPVAIRDGDHIYVSPPANTPGSRDAHS